MKLSVIIPCYNAEKTIKKCLDSIVNQTEKNIEIILIDDGSTDKTFKICSEYQKKDDRIRFYKKNNTGVSDTRNYGIEVATGDYITFVDSDDYILNDTYSKIMLILQKKAYDFIRYNFKFDSDLKNKLNYHDKINGDISNIASDELLKYFICDLNSYPTYTPLLIIKKEIIKKLKFDTNFSYLEDQDFYIQLINITCNGYLYDLKNYVVTINDSSASRNISNKCRNIHNLLVINKKIMQYECCRKIKTEVNSSHFSLISYMLPDVYLYSKKEYKSLVYNLKYDENFKRIILNLNKNCLGMKDKIVLFFVGHNMNFCLKIFFKIILLKRRFERK